MYHEKQGTCLQHMPRTYPVPGRAAVEEAGKLRRHIEGTQRLRSGGGGGGGGGGGEGSSGSSGSRGGSSSDSSGGGEAGGSSSRAWQKMLKMSLNAL